MEKLSTLENENLQCESKKNYLQNKTARIVMDEQKEKIRTATTYRTSRVLSSTLFPVIINDLVKELI